MKVKKHHEKNPRTFRKEKMLDITESISKKFEKSKTPTISKTHVIKDPGSIPDLVLDFQSQSGEGAPLYRTD